MSAINYAIKKTMLRINKTVLSETFLKPLTRYWTEPTSIEDQIRNKVIYARVLPDMDVLGGKEVLIPLRDITREVIEQYTTIFRIPKEYTDGRSITSVLSVNFLDPTSLSMNGDSSFANCGKGELLTAANALLSSNQNIPPVSSAYVELIAENVVMVRYTSLLPHTTFLRCRIENDSELTNLPQKSWNYFAEAVLLATKAYIYTNLVVELDQGAISAGASLGAIREIIDSYSDADTMYEEFLEEKLEAVLMMSDTESYRRHLRTMFGGYR